MILNALAKYNGNLFAIAIVGRAINLERELSKKKQRGLRVITLQGAIEKRPILLSLEK